MLDCEIEERQREGWREGGRCLYASSFVCCMREREALEI